MVTLDTKTGRSEARSALNAAAAESRPPLGRVSSVQGNLDVAVLKKGASTPDQVCGKSVKGVWTPDECVREV